MSMIISRIKRWRSRSRNHSRLHRAAVHSVRISCRNHLWHLLSTHGIVQACGSWERRRWPITTIKSCRNKVGGMNIVVMRKELLLLRRDSVRRRRFVIWRTRRCFHRGCCTRRGKAFGGGVERKLFGRRIKFGCRRQRLFCFALINGGRNVFITFGLRRRRLIGRAFHNTRRVSSSCVFAFFFRFIRSVIILLEKRLLLLVGLTLRFVLRQCRSSENATVFVFLIQIIRNGALSSFFHNMDIIGRLPFYFSRHSFCFMLEM
mmetsp:Transcript_11444/g.16437  ORF Transcript_11444/g.16437 Transcript_11444/m.16437 type:complete len:261 (-) Transcript_11444:1127-1909(-)